MNVKIRNTDASSLLFFDIECVKANKELDINSEEFNLFQYKNRDKSTGELLPDNEVVELYNKSAALSPIYGKIVCISVGFIKGTTMYVKAITGEEKDIIEEFYSLVNTKGLVPTGYNIINFDLPYTRLRAFASGVDTFVNDKVSDAGKKAWHMADHVCDIMDVVKGTHYNNFSMNELAYMFGIKSPKDDIDGSQVSEVYYTEGVERIATYCNKDVVCTAEIFLALQGKRNFITEVVDKSGSKEEKPTLMKVIASTHTITAEQEKEVIAKAKELTKEERPHFVTLLQAALLEEAVKYEKLFNKILKLK